MNKILYLSIFAIAALEASQPMNIDSMSSDRGGTKPAIDAYSDGAGVFLFNERSNPDIM